MSIFDKKIKTEQDKKAVQTFVNAGKSWEEEKSVMIKNSNRTAWGIAGIMTIIAVVSVGYSAITTTNFERTEDKILSFDRATGAVEFLTSINNDTFKTLDVDMQTAISQYFVSQYVKNREGYTEPTIQKTYDLTQDYSSDVVRQQFIEEYNRPDSLDVELKKGTATVSISSVTIEEYKGENIATVIFSVDKKPENKSPYIVNYLARLSFIYEPEATQTSSKRRENPLGFVVTSYTREERN